MTRVGKVLVATTAVLSVLCLSSVTLAKDTEYSLKGEVVSIDPLAQTLTVQSVDKIPALISGTLGEFTFFMDEMTKLTMCGQAKSVEDIKVGQEVTVGYHRQGRQLYADSIAVPAPLMACLME